VLFASVITLSLYCFFVSSTIDIFFVALKCRNFTDILLLPDCSVCCSGFILFSLCMFIWLFSLLFRFYIVLFSVSLFGCSVCCSGFLLFFLVYLQWCFLALHSTVLHSSSQSLHSLSDVPRETIQLCYY